ncbi:MAG: NIL domain-containing protein [Candidatus Omnitrophota bacterium]|nr:NIL domain-containing protein [Candidatus Omnitrophota bacterium]
MPKKIVQLIFPQKLIKKPVIYTMALKCKVMPNVRRAKVTESVGEMVLELEGTRENLEKGVRFLTKQGIKVEPVVGDVIE